MHGNNSKYKAFQDMWCEAMEKAGYKVLRLKPGDANDVYDIPKEPDIVWIDEVLEVDWDKLKIILNNKKMEEIKEIIASAIANARGHRNGVPQIKNVLDILPPKLKDECFEDADIILTELKTAGYRIEK